MISHGLIEADDSHGGRWTDGFTGIAEERIFIPIQEHTNKDKPNMKPMVIQTMKAQETQQHTSHVISKIFYLNKFCSFELSIHPRILFQH